MSTQQAVIIEAPKGPFVLRTRSIPTPSEGEVLIKIMSVGLNPVNWKQGAFNILIDEYPAVVGHDVAGVVEKLGTGVEGLKKGDRVCAQTVNVGFQQYVAVPAGIMIPTIPALTRPLPFLWRLPRPASALFAPGPIGVGLNPTFSWDKPQQGHAALVIGGGPANFNYLGKLGATECIDRGEVPVESLAAHPALAPPRAAGSWLPSRRRNWSEILSKRSSLLVRVLGYYAGPDVMNFKRDVVGYVGTPEHTAFGKLLIKNLPEMLERGVISGTRYEILPNGLAGISEGLDRLRQGGVSGFKLVAHPQDPVA
ncbi:chaperonin 10-like protein [Mycena metata]|uniref:Chaperonin 10-like protein n=1 Tax=Mycena metata TaxID=1033252 RepID=A0AAD7NE44_9AGAR|nr:chaperonin 10-like protein [Mycena metata]